MLTLPFEACEEQAELQRRRDADKRAIISPH